MSQCPRCANKENILSELLRGPGPGGTLQTGVRFFCPHCQLLELAHDPEAKERLEKRWQVSRTAL